jgi:hypothetical protein
MANEYHVYVNTMVFAIVSGVVSLLLLLMAVYVPAVSAYGLLVVTVEVGLLFIVLQAVIRIWLYERKLRNEARNLATNIVAVETCPDYYTATHNLDGTVVCDNKYASPDKRTTITFPAGPATVDLSDFDSKVFADVCQTVNPTDPTDPLYNVPWSDMRGKCSSYNM